MRSHPTGEMGCSASLLCLLRNRLMSALRILLAKRGLMKLVLATLLLTTLAFAGPPIDRSPARAKTPLNPGLKRIGTLKPRAASDIQGSNWTLGCETLDRDFANYDEYKEYLVPLGIKTIRLQAGWAKTERVKGTYDFAWLDRIIDDARSRGLNILLETGYGNPNYEGGGGWDLSGSFPTSPEALAAWDRWVLAMATRYKGKVRDWAMWNEPDLNKRHTPEEIADFNIRTAEQILKVIPNARIGGLSLASSSPTLLENCLRALANKGKIGLFQWFIYHGYQLNPDDSYKSVEALKAVLAKYSPKARMRQGENGAPSEVTRTFALSKHPWTEWSQAKWDLRRMLGDLGHDVESAVFTISDFNHKDREMNRKGLLHATEDKRVDKIKLAYYAVQNTVSVFDNQLERVTDLRIEITHDKSTASYVYRHQRTGAKVFVFWDNSAIPSDLFETKPVQLRWRGFDFKQPVWVDLVSGGIYELPKAGKAADGTRTLEGVPLYDAPVLVTERSLVMP